MARRKAKRKPAKRKRKAVSKKSLLANKKSQWTAFRQLRKRVDAAWSKLQSNVKKKASPKVLTRAKNELLLLLGECNYMARETARLAKKAKRKL